MLNWLLLSCVYYVYERREYSNYNVKFEVSLNYNISAYFSISNINIYIDIIVWSCIQTAKIGFVCIMKKNTLSHCHVCTVSGLKCSFCITIQLSLTTRSVFFFKRAAITNAASAFMCHHYDNTLLQFITLS